MAPGGPGAELTLATGAFFAGYLKRFGVLGAGIGSQLYIGQLLAYSAGLTSADLQTVGVAGLIAALAAIVPRVLSGPAEQPAPAPPYAAGLGIGPGPVAPEFIMGLQAAIAAVIIVALNDAVGLEEIGLGHHRLHLRHLELHGRHDRAGAAAASSERRSACRWALPACPSPWTRRC
ncbi:MAG: hypothetical protein WDN49_20510 [Acetobacteraceae bacterium]